MSESPYVLELKAQIEDLTEELTKANAEVNYLLGDNQAMSATLSEVLAQIKSSPLVLPAALAGLTDRIASHLQYMAEEEGAR